MEFSWKFAIDAGVISTALLIATLLRSRSRFLQHFMVPNALTAGFLLLPVYNYLMPALGYTQNRLGDLVYHLLNISFIAMTLRSKPPRVRNEAKGSVWAMSTAIAAQYAIQASVGLLLTWVLFSTIVPGLNPAFGLTLPLGFAMGPGQAYAIGKGWEPMGFDGAGTVGLTMAALGYLWACLVGVALVNTGVRRGYLPKATVEALTDRTLLTGVVPKGTPLSVGSRNTTDLEAIDSMSLHAAFVAATYLLSYLALWGLSMLLGLAGKAGSDLAANLWGMNFIFSALMAMIVRLVIDKLGLGHVLDNDGLSRISGMAVDYMVTGSLAAISLVFVGQYWLPLILVSTVGGLIITVAVPWMSSRMFRDHRYERMVMIFGVSTGTLSTGLALLRILDPEFRTKVSNDYMLSAGMTFGLMIPFILAINLPALSAQTGDARLFWLMIGISGLYLVYSLVAYAILAGKRAFRQPATLWLPED